MRCVLQELREESNSKKPAHASEGSWSFERNQQELKVVLGHQEEEFLKEKDQLQRVLYLSISALVCSL